LQQGREVEFWNDWRRALAPGCRDVDEWIGYAQLSLFLGQPDEYVRARSVLLGQFGATTNPRTCERLSRACLLTSLDGGDLHTADALADRAAAAGATTDAWTFRYHLFAKGLADYRAGRLDEAIGLMEGPVGPMAGPGPRLVLAMARSRRGDAAGARQALAEGIITFDWGANKVDSRDRWIWHSLRREAQEMILPNLQAFLAGTYEPHDNDERLAMTGECQFTHHPLAGARLLQDAFAADPSRQRQWSGANRIKAARFAALAAGGEGEDAASLDEAARSQWRMRSLQWLKEDLAERMAKQPTSATGRAALREKLPGYENEPDLAGVRDAAALERLPAEQREACTAFWKDVAEAIAQFK
jgi:serine/threonine-protein kinase